MYVCMYEERKKEIYKIILKKDNEKLKKNFLQNQESKVLFNKFSDVI